MTNLLFDDENFHISISPTDFMKIRDVVNRLVLSSIRKVQRLACVDLLSVVVQILEIFEVAV